jgi:hypothetical protein
MGGIDQDHPGHLVRILVPEQACGVPPKRMPHQHVGSEDLRGKQEGMQVPDPILARAGRGCWLAPTPARS